MGSLNRLSLLFAATLVVPGAATAADLSPIYYDATVVPTPYEVSSNWYVRGDLGYKWYSSPNATFDYPGYGKMTDTSLEDTGVVGLGFGYKFNNYFRSDITIDYEWASQFKGKLICPDPCTGKPGKEFSTEYADIDAWTGLLNFYLDFDLSGEGLGGFIPYVGAGVGLSNLTTSNVNYVNPNGTEGTWKGDSTTNLAWAVMAGVAIPMSNNWLIDVNYRYVDLGDARSAKTLPQYNNQRIKYNDITASEIRVGFRYMID